MFSIRSSSKREKGQGLVEYAIIVALIAIVVIVAVGMLGRHTSWQYGDVVCMQDQGWLSTGGCGSSSP